MTLIDVAKNVLWLLLDKVLRVIVGVYIFSKLSYGLGEAAFGYLNFVISIMAILGAVVSMGMQNVVVKHLVSTRSGLLKHEIVWTVLISQIFIALVVYVSLFVAVYFVYDVENLYVYLLMGVLIVCRPSDVFKYWFESNLKMKSVVVIENVNFILFSVLKVVAVEVEAGIAGIALIFSIEYVFNAAGLLIVYRLGKKKGGAVGEFNKQFLSDMFRMSWPLAVSSIAWVGYIKVDQIMVGAILGDIELAYFSASSKIVESLYFIPAAIVSSVYPYLFASYIGEAVKEKFTFLFDILTWPILLVIIIITMFGSDIIMLVYSKTYISSINVLLIQVWCLIFVSYTIATGKYLVEVGLPHFIMYRHLVGLVVNILLNYILIQEWGLIGGAFATLISLFVASIMVDVFSKKTRFLIYLKARSLHPLSIFKRIITYAKK